MRGGGLPLLLELAQRMRRTSAVRDQRVTAFEAMVGLVAEKHEPDGQHPRAAGRMADLGG